VSADIREVKTVRLLLLGKVVEGAGEVLQFA
jgi:hypothetical protein